MSRTTISQNGTLVNVGEPGSIRNVGLASCHRHRNPSCAEADIGHGDIWGTEPPYKCGQSVVSFYSEAQRRIIVIPLHCGRLDCPTCGPWWRKRLEKRLERVMSGHGQLFLIRVSPERWPALSRGLQRAMKRMSEGGNYPAHGWASWRLGDDLYVISSVPVQLRNGACTVTPLDRCLAEELVGSFTEQLVSKRHYSSSFSWGEERERSDYRRLGYAQADLDEVRRVADMLGLLAYPMHVGGTEAVFIEAPPNVSQGGVRSWATACWSALPAGPGKQVA